MAYHCALTCNASATYETETVFNVSVPNIDLLLYDIWFPPLLHSLETFICCFLFDRIFERLFSMVLKGNHMSRLRRQLWRGQLSKHQKYQHYLLFSLFLYQSYETLMSSEAFRKPTFIILKQIFNVRFTFKINRSLMNVRIFKTLDIFLNENVSSESSKSEKTFEFWIQLLILFMNFVFSIC